MCLLIKQEILTEIVKQSTQGAWKRKHSQLKTYENGRKNIKNKQYKLKEQEES